jgi:predicted dehydrogenase
MMKRKNFIKTTSAILGGTFVAPYIVPASVFGNEGQTAPSNRIVMGCIGLGGQGTHNMRQFIQNKDVEVVALCDVDKGSTDYGLSGTSEYGLQPTLSRAIDYYARRGIVKTEADFTTHTDYREILDRDDIDAVSVSTPDHWHGKISYDAARAHKDIYCEKPLVNSITEGRAVCDAVKYFGVVLQTGSHERSNDSVRFAAELVRNGRIGKLHTIEINLPNTDNHHKWILEHNQPQPKMPVPPTLDYDLWLGPAPWRPYTKFGTHFYWRFITDHGGGEMTDRGAHIIDLAQLVNDTDNSGPTEITGVGACPETGLYNAYMDYHFECKYENGVNMIGTSYGKRGLRLLGTDGWIFINIHGGRLESEPSSLLREKIDPNELHLERSPGHHQDFINCVKGRKRPLAHAEIGHRTATICHLLNIAYATGRKLNWDPVSEQISNDREVNRMVTKAMRSPWHV